MKLVAKTDIGSQRSENQDSYRGGRRPDDAGETADTILQRCRELL